MVLVDGDHRGPIINAVAWILIITAAMVVCAKIVVKRNLSRRLGFDDFFIILSFIFIIGLTIGTGIQITNGLGTHAAELSGVQVENFKKALFATEICFLSTVYTTKICYAAILRTFAQFDRYKLIVDVYRYALGVWIVISILVAAFGCQAPRTWDIQSQECINFDAFWTFNTIVDVASQLFLSLLPILLLRTLNLSAKKKHAVICFHLPLMTTIPFSILRVVSMQQADPPNDITWNWFFPTLYTVLEAQWAVIIVALTFLIPVVESLATGLISARVGLHPNVNGPYFKHSNGVRSRFKGSGNETASDDGIALARIDQ